MTLEDKELLNALAAPVMLRSQQHNDAVYHFTDGGLTKREYAAIHLKVPRSGNEELDTMIRESQRFELAKAATQGLVKSWSVPCGPCKAIDDMSRTASTMADAMLARMEEGEE